MKKNAVLWVDFIRVIATFSVVWVHSAAPLLYRYDQLPPADWWAGNIYDSMARMSVPLFFISSGYLLLGKQETLRVYFAKRIGKVLIPLLAWSIFYIFWKHFLNIEALSFRSFYNLLFSPTYFHLWFLYALIGLYLYVPVLRILVQHSSREILYYFVALWFLAVSAIPFIERATHSTSGIDLKMISGFVGYLVIGHLLGQVRIDARRLILILFAALVCAAVTMIGTFFLTVRHHGVLDEYFYGAFSPNVILLSASAFLLLKHASDKLLRSEKPKAVINSLSSASFGIYLLHPAVMYALGAGWLGFSWDASSTHAICSVPILAILTFGISFAIVSLLQRIPYIRKTVP